MKDALIQALKTYGGPSGLIADLEMFAQCQKEEASNREEELDLPYGNRKRVVLSALESYWSAVEEALEGVEQQIDKAEQEFYDTAASHTKRLPWKLDPQRLVLKVGK